MHAESIFSAVVAAPCFKLGARTDESGRIFEIEFLPPETAIKAPLDDAGRQFVEAWARYMRDPHTTHFSLPFATRGTLFQQRVWHAISEIPPGRTLTYGELAQRVGNVPRAVGQACGANPFPVFVPCHRVLAGKGAGGFAHATGGWLIAAKLWLLSHEGLA